MNQFTALLVGLSFYAVAHTAAAAGQSGDRLQACLHQKQERNAAMQARDWEAMERFANAYIKRCAGTEQPRDFSTAHWEAAMAAMKLGRPASAVKYLDRCIEVSYANASCHVQKIYVLIRMQRTGEARKLHATASRLIDGQLEATERALRGPVAGIEKEALEIELESLQLSQRSLAMYAEDLQ
jgi:hypothetical protein